VVAAFQVVMLGVLYVSIGKILRSIGRAELALLLALSSAFFVTFWVADPEGSVRKELIAFAGLALTAAGFLTGSVVKSIMGTVLFGFSIVSHEAMLLLVPVFLALLLFGWGRFSQEFLFGLFALVASLSAFTIWFVLNFNQVGTPESVCRPLLERGLQDHLCGGAIGWLQHDMDYGMDRVREMLDVSGMVKFSVIYCISLLPFVLISCNQRQPGRFLLALVLAAVPFVPLYIIAIDWGRWIGLHVFSATILFSMLLATGRAISDFPIRRSNFYGMITLGLVLSPGHVLGILTIIR